jgi:hypothetical protein
VGVVLVVPLVVVAAAGLCSTVTAGCGVMTMTRMMSSSWRWNRRWQQQRLWQQQQDASGGGAW